MHFYLRATLTVRMHLRTLWFAGNIRLAVNTTTEEVFIILGNNLLHAAITRARQALPYRARARMLWHFLSINLSCDRIQTGQACV